jgi:proteasome accessory factor B
VRKGRPIGNDRGVTRAKTPRAATRRARSRISFEDMAARRAERLVNLVICLLSTRQFLTAERIRDAVPGYEPSDGDPRTDEAFKRMFERDKAELRDLGVPLETGRNSVFDADDGYRITRREYELPAIEFDPSEAAAVGLAARLWQSAALGTPARNALIKLRAGGTDVEATSTGVLPHVDASDPSLPTFLDAARHARAVRFDYVKSGSAKPERRDIEPWGVLSWRRRWYVVGFDRNRDDMRSFRLSRVHGEVTPYGKPGAFERPEKVDLLEAVAGRRPDEDRVARVRVTGTGGAQLRRYASRDDEGVLTITFSDLSWLARAVASAGASARALEPPDLVEAVRARLAAVADGAR